MMTALQVSESRISLASVLFPLPLAPQMPTIIILRLRIAYDMIFQIYYTRLQAQTATPRHGVSAPGCEQKVKCLTSHPVYYIIVTLIILERYVFLMDDGDSSDNPNGFTPHKKNKGMTCVIRKAAGYAFFVLFGRHLIRLFCRRHASMPACAADAAVPFAGMFQIWVNSFESGV